MFVRDISKVMLMIWGVSLHCINILKISPILHKKEEVLRE